jgi:AP-2 complex subunit beta-1
LYYRYASEVDIDFVRKSVRAIGRVAIKVEATADACIKALLELIETKVSYVVQEAVIVIKDVFRRYPGKYEGVIPVLCENLDALDEPESKAAMVWIIGQFANRIENADELMDDLTFGFMDEPVEVCLPPLSRFDRLNHFHAWQVQLALLTASVKLFIYKSQSNTAKTLVHKVLKWATEEVDNPDLRDRGFMYWRMLAINPSVAGEIVLAEKPAITNDSDRMDRGALDQLLLHTATLGSIYHKNPEVCFSFASISFWSTAVLIGRQTFIRGAAGRALTDSPALNPLSRQVLVPLSRPMLPQAVQVGGPGPVEPATKDAVSGDHKPTPAIPAHIVDDGDEEGEGIGMGEGTHGEDDEEDHITSASRSLSMDPYANLDSAFASSTAGGGTGARKSKEEEDLLFWLP